VTYLVAAPEDLINRLRIEGPDEIDIEAVAEYCGATVVYEPLRGCGARLIGRHGRAFITVNESSPRDEQRFSVAHELGHWHQDRGEIVTACDEVTLSTQWSRYDNGFWNGEFFANHYAAGLLLPTKILRPLAENVPVTFDGVEELARLFQAPLIATAVRLVDVTPFPAALVCSYVRYPSEHDERFELGRVVWATKSGNGLVFMPHYDEPGRDTVAFRLLCGGSHAPTRPPAEDMPAGEWFYIEGEDYTISEHSIKLAHNLVLSLLWWKDEAQTGRLRREKAEAWEECG
jgi:hypothetical protein